MTDQGPSLDRAIRDYLAHSRSFELYASEDDYWRADEAWWDRLMWAIEDELRPFLEAAAGD